MQNLEYDGRSRGARLTGLVSSSLVLAALSASFGGVAPPQLGPAIVSTPLVCMATTEFSVVDALITPSDQIRTGRIYFRSDSYPDYYFVELTRIGDHFQAVLPKPNFETQRVIFYFEAVDVSFNITTTPESEAEVVEDADSCRRRDPKAAFYTGQNPSIIVGATSAAAPALPPGFAIEGIAQVISVAGAAGGIGAGTLTIAAVGAAAAAGVGLGMVASDESPPPEPPGPSGPPTGGTGTVTVSSTTTTVNVVVSDSLKACFETRPNPPVIMEGERITLDGRCSTPRGDLAYEWDLGDGRTRDQAFIEPTYSVAGTYGVTLTVYRPSAPRERSSVSRTIRVEEPPPATADLQIVKTASVTSVNACEDFQYILKVSNLGPDIATGITLVDCLPDALAKKPGCEGGAERFDGCSERRAHPRCPDAAIVCELPDLRSSERAQRTFHLLGPIGLFNTITNTAFVIADQRDPNTNNNEDSVTISVAPCCFNRTSLVMGFTSVLEIAPPDGSATANFVINRDQVLNVNNASPFRIQVGGRAGRNSIEAYLVSSAKNEGVLRFDFTGGEHFVPGSIQVARGDVVGVEANRVLFRLAGNPGEKIQFTFVLEP